MKEITVENKPYFLLTVKEVNDNLISVKNEMEQFREKFVALEKKLTEKELEELTSFDNDITNAFAKEYADEGLKENMPINLLFAVFIRVQVLYEALQEADLHDLVLTDRRVETNRDVLSLFLAYPHRKLDVKDSLRLIPFCEGFYEW